MPKAQGQKRIAVIHWTRLCSDDILLGVVGRWGDPVFT